MRKILWLVLLLAGCSQEVQTQKEGIDRCRQQCANIGLKATAISFEPCFSSMPCSQHIWCTCGIQDVHHFKE